jgi:REP element-mobilizing transposase RayT
MRPSPIYTSENCRPAYQLNWSLSVFWNHALTAADWLSELQAATEADGVRVLEHRFARADISQFLVSHPMADPRIQSRFERYQVSNPAIDLSQPRQSGSGIYWYNLHLVFVHAERFCDVREESLDAVQRMILAVSAKHGYLLSRAGIVADHVHLTASCPPDQSPVEVALRYMNNIAYTYAMKPVFAFGFYAGTFGEYDLNVIPGESS